MHEPGLDDVVDALVDAHRRQRLADSLPLQGALATADDAYAVQDRVAQLLGWNAAGAARAWKSGGADPESITHASLPPAGVWGSPAQAQAWPLRLGGIEAEIALRLAFDVDAALAASLARPDECIDAMTVSIELVESRWAEQLDAAPLFKLADRQSHSALVLGDWVPYERREWSGQRCVVRIGNRQIERRGSHSLGDPAAVLLPWLRHATRGGGALRAGTVVTTGTWVGLQRAAPGDPVHAVFDGIGDARVQL